MNSRKYQKKLADARRSVSRKYGFRQSSYINFKVENGYFFCLYFLTDEARLTVKPMYADDLWWDIWGASENKKEPLSLRGTGAYSLSGQMLATYQIAQTTDEGGLSDTFTHIFQDAGAVIAKFLAEHPDADSFYPDESKMWHDPDRLLYLMALIHNGSEAEALAIIKEARKKGHRCMFQSGMFSDSYTYIHRWITKQSLLSPFRIWAQVRTKYSDSTENSRRVSAAYEADKCKRKPWYRLLPEWIYWILFAPILFPLLFYFFDLHRRSLYDLPWWIWAAGSLLFALYFLISSLRNGLKGSGLTLSILMSVTFGLCSGIFAVGACAGLFDGINRLFASEPIEATATVTFGKFLHKGRGRGDLSRYITVVNLDDENKIMKIDDVKLYDIPPESKIVITYRRGLFGVDIFDSFTGPSK